MCVCVYVCMVCVCVCVCVCECVCVCVCVCVSVCVCVCVCVTMHSQESGHTDSIIITADDFQRALREVVPAYTHSEARTVACHKAA